jgi:threonine/homoserine/homoserine lactone efflux protein
MMLVFAILGIVFAFFAWVLAVTVGFEANRNAEHLSRRAKRAGDAAFAIAFLASIGTQITALVLFYFAGAW